MDNKNTIPAGFLKVNHWVKDVRIRSFTGPFSTVLGLNMEIYRVNLRIQFERMKIRTKKNSKYGHFLHSAY